MTKRLITVIALLFLVPVGVYALDARVETKSGEVLTIKDFSMDGRERFSVDYKGAITTIDWKDIASFEIKQVGPNFWVEIQLLDGKKEILRIRQMSPFRGRSESGKWSLPFEKVKKAFLIGDTGQEAQKEESSIKETSLSSSSTLKEMERINMRNGDILLGTILNEVVSIRTIYGTIQFQKKSLQRIVLGNPPGKGQKEREQDTLYSKYGDKLTGTISDLQIRVNLLTETELSLNREYIKEIEFGVVPESEQKTPVEKTTSTP